MTTLVNKFESYDNLSKEARNYNIKNGGLIENDTNDINARWWEARRELVDFILGNVIPQERAEKYAEKKGEIWMQNKIIEIGRTVMKIHRLSKKAVA